MIKFQRKDLCVKITPTFLLLLAWLNLLDTQNILPQVLLACLLHELAHIFTIHKCKGKVLYIVFTVTGAEIQCAERFSHFSYQQECLCAIAGITTNLALALLCSFFPQTQLFSGINLALALLNLLPMSKLDGGQALSCLLSPFLPLRLLHLIQKALDLLCASTLLALGTWIFLEGGTLTLLLLGIWLVQSAVPEK